MQPTERYEAIAAAMEVLESGVCVTDAHGRLLYQNAVLRRQLSGDAEHRLLEEAMCDARNAALARARSQGASAGEDTNEGKRFASVRSASLPTAAPPAWRVAMRVRTSAAQYRVEAVAIASAVVGSHHVVVITVQRRQPRRLTAVALKDAYGLTAREARVAALLDAGVRNREIADSLVISVHTARRHVESVLRKLGVHSRSEVRARLTERARSG